MVTICRLIVTFALGFHLVSGGGNKLPIERDTIKVENPQNYYNFGKVIGKGKFSYVKEVTEKATNKLYAAKIIHFRDKDEAVFAAREYDMMVYLAKNGLGSKQGIPMLHEAYLVRHYLVIIMELCAGSELLQYAQQLKTEDDVRSLVKRLVEILSVLHSKGITHLDVRPSNIRLINNEVSGMRLLDYNSAHGKGTKPLTEDVFGDTEFAAPEGLSFESVTPKADMFELGEVAYVLLTGESPFFDSHENRVDSHARHIEYHWPPSAGALTTEAKEFVKNLLIRVPENRLTALAALEHNWLTSSSSKFAGVRLGSDYRKTLERTDKRLLEEEGEEYLEASCVFVTFDEPDTEEEGDDDDYGRLYKEEPHQKPVLPVKPLPLLTVSGVLAVGGIFSLFLLAVIWRRGGVVHRPVALEGQTGLE